MTTINPGSLPGTFAFPRGTAAQCAAANRTLPDGTPEVEIDTLRWKLHDGVTPYNSLPYFSEQSLSLVGRSSSFFMLLAAAEVYSHVNFDATANSSSHFGGSYRSSVGALNDEAVFLLPAPLTAGTYRGTLWHSAATHYGILTIATSPDAETWADKATVDTYAGATANAVRADLGSFPVADGAQYVRLKVTGRNPANTTAYNARVSSLSLTRTGS